MNIDLLLLDTPFGQPCPWWWLWSLGAFLLGILVSCFVFGWCRYGRRIGELEEERDRYHSQFTNMEKEYMNVKYQLDETNKDNTALRASLNKCESDNAVLKVKIDKMALGTAGVVARDVGGVENKADDEGAMNYGAIFAYHNLQIIEGIGPKIEKLLKAAGLDTWEAVAKANYDTLKKVLEDAGPHYRIHDPKTWSEQAQLAHDGKWDKLIEFQKFLDAGREDQGSFETPSKVEKMAMKLLGFSNNPEDLKIIEGIGPKIEQLLKEAGIHTWSDLAAAPVEKLQSVLDQAGERYRLADPDTWPRQAELAAAGKWAALSAYQDRLKGGKE